MSDSCGLGYVCGIVLGESSPVSFRMRCQCWRRRSLLLLFASSMWNESGKPLHFLILLVVRGPYVAYSKAKTLSLKDNKIPIL